MKVESILNSTVRNSPKQITHFFTILRTGLMLVADNLYRIW